MSTKAAALSSTRVWLIVLMTSIVWLGLTAVFVSLLDVAPSRPLIAALFAPVACAWAYLAALVIKRARS